MSTHTGAVTLESPPDGGQPEKEALLPETRPDQTTPHGDTAVKFRTATVEDRS